MKNTILIFLSIISFQLFSQKKITFNASDGLEITADLYIANPENSPFIILFHQAGWSRGEYLEIAPKLNEMGYNCMAIDQRSGGEVNEIINETHKIAEQQGKGTNYVDALVDLNSAIDYVKKNYESSKKLIIWGSSYSSALVIHVAGTRKDVDAVLSFAPGEYFKRFGKPEDWIQQSAKNVSVPVFITSAKVEKKYWWEIAQAIPSENRFYFVPKAIGQHGSRALWNKFDCNEEYWEAVKGFLKNI